MDGIAKRIYNPRYGDPSGALAFIDFGVLEYRSAGVLAESRRSFFNTPILQVQEISLIVKPLIDDLLVAKRCR